MKKRNQKKKKDSGTHSVNFRMPVKYHELLLAELAPQKRSVSWLMIELTEKHLKEGGKI